MEKKKINIPQKGAAKKWSQRLKELGQQSPPKDLVKILNESDDQSKIAVAPREEKELEI